jgi:dienelactone hydrolase
MASIALFHSVLGVRLVCRTAPPGCAGSGTTCSWSTSTAAGSSTTTPRRPHTRSVGFPALMQAALDATADLPDGFVVAGFSNGAGMAEHVALHRPVAAAVLLSGALPLPFLGADAWPAAVPVQLHYAISDPHRNQDWVDQFLAAVRQSGAGAEFHEYAGAGHLFTDASLPQEFHAQATEALWTHVDDFLRKVRGPTHNGASVSAST